MFDVKTPIYGSGDGRPALPAAPQPLGFPPNPVALFTAMFQMPINLVNSFFQPIMGPEKKNDGMDGRVERRFTPHGEVVQEMTTRQLVDKNIFGAGGSQ